MNLVSTMKCIVCRKSISRSINHMCIDCYINGNLPTQVHNTPWVFMRSSVRRSFRKGRFDENLASAITSMTAKISKDKTTVFLELNGKTVSIPLTVEKIDELAQKSGILVGKWLIYRNRSEIDVVWKTVAKSTFNAELGTSAKVSTAIKKSRRHVICVYTRNYLNLEDVTRVREKLRQLGFTDELCYKPDIYTYLGIYHGTTSLSPCRYRK